LQVFFFKNKYKQRKSHYFVLFSGPLVLNYGDRFSRREMSSELGFALLTTFTVLLSYLSFSNGLLQPRRISHGLSKSSKYLTRDELWFTQTLDHYSPSVINLPNFVSSSILVSVSLSLLKFKIRCKILVTSSSCF